jgi:predicted PurR-regulated permease PerM
MVRTDTTTPTPIVITPRTGWLLLAATTVATIVLAWAAPNATRMLLGGVAIALFLAFPVKLLDRFMPRRLAVLASLVGLFVLSVIGLVFMLPLLGEQVGAAIDALPQLGSSIEDSLRRGLQALHDRGVGPNPDRSIEFLGDKATGRLEDALEDLLGGLVGGASTTIGTLAQLFGMLFVAGYLLATADTLKAAAVGLTPAPYRRDVEALLSRIGESLSRFLAGLVAAAAIQGIIATLALWLVGVPNALLLGVVTAFAACLPVVGIWLAAVVAVLAALTQSPATAGLVALVYVAIFFLDRNVVSPRLQSRALRVSAPITILAIVAGEQIAGPLGTVLALPIVGIVRVIFDFLIERLRIMPAGPAQTAAEPVTGQGPGYLQRFAPLLNLTMSVVVVPENRADVRSASRLALQVGDATLAAEKNDIRLVTTIEPEGAGMTRRH